MIVAVINADDFGLSTGINEGISVAHEQGILRSASLMPNGEAFSDAVDRIRQLPDLGVGVHLSLVGETPIAPVNSLRGLARQGKLPDSYAAFARDYLLRRFSLAEVRREMRAQIDQVLEAGIQPTHLDSHQHIHLLPGILELTLDLAQAYQINVVRVPDDRTGLFRMRTSWRRVQLATLVLLSALARKKIAKSGLKSAGFFHGLAASGRLDTESLSAILSRLQDGINEVMCHPGLETAALRQRYAWGYAWETEMAALRSSAIKQIVKRRGIRLRNFAEAWSTSSP
jgi:hopanoid biosynthesis associated protein HpnK